MDLPALITSAPHEVKEIATYFGGTHSETVVRAEVQALPLSIGVQFQYSFGNFTSGSIAISPRIETTLQWLLRYGIRLDCPSEIREYFYYYPGLLDIVRDISQDAARAFPEPAQLSLEVFTSHEDGDKLLTLQVRYPEYSGSIEPQIEEVFDRYFDRLVTIPGDFIFTTDYQFPR